MRGGQTIVRNDKILYPELSYQINGVLMDVAKTLGGGHKENYYGNACAVGFTKRQISFQREVYVPLTYEDEKVGKYFVDFLIENKIILELKRGQFISSSVIEQTKQYLVAKNLKLGIIGCFTYNGVVIKRVVNEY